MPKRKIEMHFHDEGCGGEVSRELLVLLNRIVKALERLSPPPLPAVSGFITITNVKEQP